MISVARLTSFTILHHFYFSPVVIYILPGRARKPFQLSPHKISQMVPARADPCHPSQHHPSVSMQGDDMPLSLEVSFAGIPPATGLRGKNCEDGYKFGRNLDTIPSCKLT